MRMNKYGIPKASIVEQYVYMYDAKMDMTLDDDTYADLVRKEYEKEQNIDNVKKIKTKEAIKEYKNTEELLADIQKIDSNDEIVLKRLLKFFNKKFWWIVNHPTFSKKRWNYYDKEVVNDVKGIVTLNFYKTLRILKNDSNILAGKSLKIAENIITSYVRNFSYSQIFKVLNIERNKYGQYVLVRHEYMDKETGLFAIKDNGNYRKSGERRIPISVKSEVEDNVLNKIIVDKIKELTNSKNDYKKELFYSLLGKKSIKQIAKDTGIKEITLYKRREKLIEEFRTYLKLN